MPTITIDCDAYYDHVELVKALSEHFGLHSYCDYHMDLTDRKGYKSAFIYDSLEKVRDYKAAIHYDPFMGGSVSELIYDKYCRSVIKAYDVENDDADCLYIGDASGPKWSFLIIATAKRTNKFYRFRLSAHLSFEDEADMIGFKLAYSDVAFPILMENGWNYR
jgi:hypothetical protein